MTPKKPDHLYEQTAKQFQLPEKVVKDLIEFYYKDVRDELAQVNKTRVEIRGLGSFDLKYFKVKYKLRDLKNLIIYHSKKTGVRSEAILQNLKGKLEVLERAQRLANERETKYEEVRKNRKIYVEQNNKSPEE